MAHTKSSKHEYNKPQLKNQIEAAMAAFLKSGRAVERVPTVTGLEPPLARANGEGDGESDHEETAEAGADEEVSAEAGS